MTGLSGGLLTSFERAYVNRDLHNMLPRTISAHIPSYTDCVEVGCGFDDFSQGALNPACTVCGGTGRITTWSIAYLVARTSWVDRSRIGIEVYKGVVAGEIGDAIIQGFARDFETYIAVKDTDGAYITLDQYRVRPISVSKNQVEGASTVDVRCNIVRE